MTGRYVSHFLRLGSSSAVNPSAYVLTTEEVRDMEEDKQEIAVFELDEVNDSLRALIQEIRKQ